MGYQRDLNQPGFPVNHAFQVLEINPPIARHHDTNVEPGPALKFAQMEKGAVKVERVRYDIGIGAHNAQPVHHKVLACAGVGDIADLRRLSVNQGREFRFHMFPVIVRVEHRAGSRLCVPAQRFPACVGHWMHVGAVDIRLAGGDGKVGFAWQREVSGRQWRLGAWNSIKNNGAAERRHAGNKFSSIHRLCCTSTRTLSANSAQSQVLLQTYRR